MGNQPSKDGLMDSQRRIRPALSNSNNGKNNSSSNSNNQLDKNRVTASKSSRLIPTKKNKEIQKNTISRPVIVSPVRHQLVLTDHVTPLVSLSAASSFGIYQRRSSSTPYRDTRSMSSSSITSEEWEPNTPTTHYSRSSYDEYGYSFLTDVQQKKLSSSLPVKHSDGFIINTTGPFQTAPAKPPSHGRRDSREIWVYEYGAEKERDRYFMKQCNRKHVGCINIKK